MLARRSIHNVSGWPYRTESAFFAFTDEPYARKRQARQSPTPSTFKAYSFTGYQATSNCHLERPPRPSKRHNRAGQYPDPKTKTTRVLSRAVSDVAIGQRTTYLALRRTSPYDLTPRLTAVVQFTAHPLFTPKHHSTSLSSWVR